MVFIIIGTTPTITYTFKTVSPSDFRACILTIKCNGQILIEKNLSDAEIGADSVWRITFDGTEYICTATQTLESFGYTIGNPLYSGGADDGSGVPLNLYRSPWGAWSGGADASAGSHTLKVERQVAS